jgi:outer membrane protein OmpA-like peptidoglycan-associated protein
VTLCMRGKPLGTRRVSDNIGTECYIQTLGPKRPIKYRQKTMKLKTPVVMSLVGLLVLTACEDQPTRIDNPNYRAQNGAATGAIFGGIVGAAVNPGSGGDARLRSALVGAAIGAAAGGVIGASLDNQAADLRNNLGNPNVTVTNMGKYLVVNLPDDLLFATDSSTLRPQLQSELRSIAANLVSYPNSNIRVIGHTDNVGAAAYNIDLSLRRARSVMDVLAGAGVPGSRLSAVGMGEDQPIASNLSTSGRAQNRRVEIIITPKR